MEETDSMFNWRLTIKVTIKAIRLMEGRNDPIAHQHLFQIVYKYPRSIVGNFSI